MDGIGPRSGAVSERANGHTADGVAALIDFVLDQRAIFPVFQPLTDLYSGDILGYEALARGPEGPLATPSALFAAAREVGRLGELDRLCQSVAIERAEAAGMRAPYTLFVNAEPETFDSRLDSGLPGETVPAGMRVVVEITERALTARVADLIPAVRRFRERGIGIALDDVGSDRRSLALMPFVRPDVVKLDMRLTHDGGSEAMADVHLAVSAYAEAYGAVVVAEGVETEAHHRHARAMGATIGQGWLLGPPEPLTRVDAARSSPITFNARPALETPSPFQAVDDCRTARIATKQLLLAVSEELELQASLLGSGAVLISAFQHERFFGPERRARYRWLGKRLAFVGALGRAVESRPVSGVRGGDLLDGDPVAHEWDVVVVGPHFAGAMVAQDLGDDPADDEARRFSFHLTYDRELVLAIARSLMGRIAPEPIVDLEAVGLTSGRGSH